MKALQPLLSRARARRVDDHRVISGIIYVIGNGLPDKVARLGTGILPQAWVCSAFWILGVDEGM